MDAKPDALTALCRGSSSGLAAGGVWSPPLPAPVALFQLFPCGRRWHSQNPITPSFRLLSMTPQFKSQRTPCLGLPVCPALDPHKSSPSRTKVYLS